MKQKTIYTSGDGPPATTMAPIWDVLLKAEGPLGRTEIGKRANVSPGQVTRTMVNLRKKGLVDTDNVTHKWRFTDLALRAIREERETGTVPDWVHEETEKNLERNLTEAQKRGRQYKPKTRKSRAAQQPAREGNSLQIGDLFQLVGYLPDGKPIISSMDSHVIYALEALK